MFRKHSKRQSLYCLNKLKLNFTLTNEVVGIGGENSGRGQKFENLLRAGRPAADEEVVLLLSQISSEIE
jgi:hypothetical protein